MTKLFHSFYCEEEEESANRWEDIKEYIYFEYFGQNQPPYQHGSIFYVDPYFDVEADLYEKLKNHRNDESLVLEIFNDIKDCFSISDFKIITRLSLENLRRELVTKKEERIVSFKHTENHNTTFHVGQFKDSKTSFPNKLHDRWLLWHTSNNYFGLHLGTSLNSIEGQDLTITTISNKDAPSFWKRANHVWETCTYFRGAK